MLTDFHVPEHACKLFHRHGRAVQDSFLAIYRFAPPDRVRTLLHQTTLHMVLGAFCFRLIVAGPPASRWAMSALSAVESRRSSVVSMRLAGGASSGRRAQDAGPAVHGNRDGCTPQRRSPLRGDPTQCHRLLRPPGVEWPRSDPKSGFRIHSKGTPHNLKHVDDDQTTNRSHWDSHCRDALRGPMNSGISVGPPHVYQRPVMRWHQTIGRKHRNRRYPSTSFGRHPD
jgi:hypothetical protein